MEAQEVLDIPNEGEPRPLDRVTEEERRPIKYPVPRRGGPDEEILVHEVSAEYWDDVEGKLNFLSPEEKQFYQTLTVWMDERATGKGEQSQAIRSAIKDMVDRCTPKEDVKGPGSVDSTKT